MQKYKVLQMFTFEGKRYQAGDEIELTAEVAATFAPGFINNESVKGTKGLKSVIKKK